jgi:toxin ParE1/3/4
VTRVLLTSLADADTARIIDYLGETAGVKVAEHFAADFASVYLRLERFPDSGAPRTKLGANVRVAVVWPYAILYQYVEAEDTVTIMRIVHGRREITRRLLGGV